MDKLKYFKTMYDLTDGVAVRVEVEVDEIQALKKPGRNTKFVEFANVPERAMTLYIDDRADIPSSTPDKLAYTVLKDDESGKWLLTLSDPLGRTD